MIEEEPLFIGVGSAKTQIVLDRIGVEEVLRCLHKPDVRIMEQRQRPADEPAVRHEIGIQYGDEIRGPGIAGQHAKGVVDIAGL